MTMLSKTVTKGGVSVEGAQLGYDSIHGDAGRIERLLVKIIAIEFLVVAGTCFLTSWVYYAMVLSARPATKEYALAAVTVAVLVLLIALGFKQYAAIQTQSRDRYLWSAMGAVTLAFSLFLSLLFLFKIADWYSRGTFICQFLGVSAAILITRKSTYWYVRRAIRSGAVQARKAIFVGDSKANHDILEKLHQSGIRWAGDLPFPFVHGNKVPGIEASNGIRTFVEQCRGFQADDIFILTTAVNVPQTGPLVDALSELPVTVHIIPALINEFWSSATIANFGETFAIQVLHPPLSNFDVATKRGLDICVAGLSLIVLSPLLLMVALAIKLETRGPALFRQNRHGYNNEVIPL